MRFLLVAAAALWSTVAPIGAQDNPGEPPKTGSVAGIVVEEKSGGAVTKAIVILRRNQQDSGIGAATTTEGKFTLRDLDPGAYLITVERDGYIVTRGQPQTVTVQAGQTTSDVTLKLLRTGAISGRVLDPDGDPVSGVGIALSSTRARKNGRPETGYATTNDRGEYRIYQIAPGDYRLTASYTPRSQRDRFRMQTPATPGGPPAAAEAYPTLYYPGTLDTRQAAVVKVEPEADLQGFDLQLVRMHGVRVRGRVITASGNGPRPLFQIVTLASVGGERTGPSHESLIQDSKGEFEFQDVLPGTYRLAVQAGGLNQEARMTAQRTLDVGDVDIEGIELIPAQPQPLSGRVVAPEGRRLPPGLIVVLESRESGDRQGGGLAQVAADGTFSIPQVAPGDYNPILGSSASGYDDAYIQAIRSGDSDALAEGVHIGTSPTPALEIVLKANGAAAEGTVTDDKGDPVPNASILLVPDPPKQGRSALFGQCQTGADGTCKIFGITPGEYHAYAFPAGGEIDRRDPEALKPFESYGQAIQFAEGEQKVVSLKTPPDE